MEAESNQPLVEVIPDAVLEDVETYITQRQNTVTQYIATWPILDLCEEADQRLGAWVSKQ